MYASILNPFVDRNIPSTCSGDFAHVYMYCTTKYAMRNKTPVVVFNFVIN